MLVSQERESDIVSLEKDSLDDPIPIEDWYDLDDIRNDLDGDYILKENLTETTDGYRDKVTNNGWDPIYYERDDEGFKGSLDGNGYVISDLIVDESGENVGLFGKIEGEALIENIRIYNFTVGGDERVGGLTGVNEGMIVNTSVQGQMLGDELLGGLVGDNQNEIIRSCADIDIEGDGNYIGGLVGGNDGDIYDSYSHGLVSGVDYIGGLVGGNSNLAHIENTFSTVEVHSEGKGYEGGLIGRDQGGTVADSFWDVETSGIEEDDIGTGKTTAEMKDVATYTDIEEEGLEDAWDFVGNPNDDEGDEEIWDIDEDEEINEGYPFLEWEEEDDIPEKYELTVYIEGEGSTDPAEGTHEYEEGEKVTVEAVPDEGWEFVEWEGDYEGTDEEITITMDDDKEVTAVFEEIPTYELDVEIEGEGKVEIDPEEAEYVEGTDVTLTADADEHWYFAEWTGDYEGEDEEITITMDDDKEITAVFEEIPIYELTVEIEGEGEVEIEPEQDEYEEGTEVELEAIPDEGWEFVEWTGDYEETDEEITITMDEDKEITAHFEEEVEYYDLTIDIEGEGTTDPAEGTHAYEEVTEVTVEATPDEGWEFVEWTGDYEEEDAEITITMDEDKEITAHFSEEPYEFNITVRESDLLVISDALVELRCNETDEVKYDNITDEDGIAHFPEVSEGVYEYTITHEEYEEKTGVAEVYKDKEIDVELEPLDVYRLELNVKGSGMVHIETEDESWELDHDSIKIDFTVDTEVSLYAEADEGWVFSEWTGQVPENKAEEMSFNVTMDEKREMVVHFEEVVEEYDLTFVVEDEWEEPVEGATVMLNGKTVQTDGDGNAVFEDLEPGIYDYEVDHEHFETVEDEVEIVDEDVVEEVTLTEKIVEEYDITFEIEDEDGELIEGAEVTVDGERLETGDEGEVVFEDMEPDSYDYTVEKEGHETVDNYVTIEDEGVTERVILEEESVEKYDITFEIEDEDGELIEGAEVTVDGETLETGDEGEAVFEDMEPDSYDYTVEKEGYETVDNYVTIEDERVTESVILKEDDVVEKYDLTFEVQDEDGENIENAEITVDGETLGTDEEGEAVFEDINSGTYDYTVEKDGYEIVEDELTVDDENVVESVTLMEKEDDDDDTPGFTLLLLVLGLLVAVKLYGGQKQSC